MGRILCFGELLLRLSPAPDGAWLKDHSMPVYLGGAELNVAMALSKWQLPVSYCTALPDNYLSVDISKAVKEENIFTDTILYSGERIGTYFLPQGTDMKQGGVIYDRAHSAFGELKRGMLDWDRILKDVSWFHFSAISPALNSSIAEVCQEGLEAASKRNITISVDLNHRPKLWKDQRHPPYTMLGLVNYCDVVMGNIWSAHQLLGIPLHESQLQQSNQASYLKHAKLTSFHILKKFSRCKTVANTFRFDQGPKGILYYATLYSGDHLTQSPVFSTDTIVDKVGTGDCFMAGLIYGMYQHWPEAQIIRFAASAAFGKFLETGDSTNQDIEMIQTRIKQYA